MAMADYTARNGQYFNLAFEAFINGSAELLVSSPPWANLFKEGRKYWVNVSFDNSKPQRLLAVAYSENGLAFSELTFDAILALAKSNTLILQYQGNRIAGLNLPGSYEAVDKTIGCANALKTYIQNDGTGPADVDDGTGPADQVPGTTLAPLQQQTPAPPPKPTAPPAPTTPAPSAAPTPINL
ncbi:hypothetical protein [Rhizobium sp. BK068]|uniref:hypothetical protein n=1 Tax=Rhizobium sp. BK068 TaxID=2512130 RepID=UPI001A9EBA3F|nr:hypothetical protein [Rhizobium sp. BK068]